MTEHETDTSTTTTNTAESGATIGVQAESVHNSNIYVASAEDPPERQYEVGVNYLTNGVPLRAREWIDAAIARGHENAEVRFHWALAMLSKRSYRELSFEERSQLGSLPQHLARFSRDEWTRALDALCELLAQLDSHHRDPAAALTKLRNLPFRQREKIMHHCDLVLTGSTKDSLWAEIRRGAQQQQHAHDRSNRVWAYFEPDPIPARARQPDANSATTEDRLRAALATVVFTGALGGIGWILLERPTVLAIVAYFTTMAGGVVAAKTGCEWLYRTHRLRAKELAHRAVEARAAPEGGFADQVNHAFQYYATKFTPKGVDGSGWMAETSGIRATLRDEVVELYRESRISTRRVTWLIRFLVRDVRRRWSKGLLFAYRQQYRTPPSTQAWCLSAAVVGGLAACIVIEAAMRSNPLLFLPSAVITVVGARAAIRRWWHIYCERRRVAEQHREYVRARDDREAEYRRWADKLEATCPTEGEMESWLRCDRALIVDEALQHYCLAWQDITAYTIVQTPVQGSKRARVNNGPWRYSKYVLRLFLITGEGVRELVKELDVEHGTFHGQERGHFRFDAISSLRVTESGYNYTLELTLSNGPTRTIDVTEPERTTEQATLDEPGLARTSLDSTGFTHALHVLEGVAAEGKAWVQREAARTQHNRNTFSSEGAAA